MSRNNVYYWKCDRPAAFHGTEVRGAREGEMEGQLLEALRTHFQTQNVSLKPTDTQGNHITWTAVIDKVQLFIRVENGPEKDQQLEVESAVMAHVAALGVAVPQVAAFDVTRATTPFAWQAMSLVPAQNLNDAYKAGTLDVRNIAFALGKTVARWQTIEPDNFGPFDIHSLRQSGRLSGFHPRYEDYFHLRLNEHLAFLSNAGFLTHSACLEIQTTIATHQDLLQLERGCLVHKDLALWNVLGDGSNITAFIDFDDAISGDPMDDLSLLACFHDCAFLTATFEGYGSVRALPYNHMRRFWLHLLRNMIVKAVIRIGAGYFQRDSGFFLIGKSATGAELSRFTLERLRLALDALQSNAPLSIL